MTVPRATNLPTPASAGVRRPVVYLHVGAPKSGTTYLQAVLWHNRRALARDGVLYPVDSSYAHFHAALDLRGTRFHGYDDPAVPGAWQRVVDQVRRWRGPTVVISHEMLSWVNEDQARRAVASLAPAEVHVIYTARDLARQVPAMWQEAIKNGRVVGFRRYLRRLGAPGRQTPSARIFWGAQDAVDVLRRWGAAVPLNRMHVLTVPRPGAPRELLWERFASVVGLDPARYDTDVGGSNVSLGMAEVELLRRVNRVVRGRLEWPVYEEVVKRWFAETLLASRPAKEAITLPAGWREWTAKQSTRLVEALRDGGYDVVGDLDDLLAEPEPAVGPGRGRAGRDAVRDVAVDAIATLLTEKAARSGRRLARRRRANAARLRARGALRRLGARARYPSDR